MKLCTMKLCFNLLIVLIICCDRLDAGLVRRRSRNRINKINDQNVVGTKHRNCGYSGCPKPKPDMLNVHIVPHTHDDVGWLKTVDQYYYGSRTETQKAGVQYILDSVIDELLSDPNKRFIYVESAFFFKWWNKQTVQLQQQVYQLVQEGRLEFIGGAWSMNDEAATHYQSIIDQFTWGLRQLNDTFGECGRPKVGWQIDPFGHSRELASLLAQMGYDGLFLGRIDYQDKSHRFTHRNAEMIWRASDSLGKKADLFTGVLYNTYSPPPGFCFDILCSDDPIIDDKRSTEFNVDEKVNEFFNYVELMQMKYRSNNILVTMGEDFHYQEANVWYTNLDKLILHANERQLSGSDINLFYSTPSCYLKALYDSNISWPTKNDDFFPYASDPHSFWTGYFTSRPTLKRFERVGNHFLQVCKQLTVLAPKQKSDFVENLSNLREAMGVMQHHDAVTGTEKQHVANDYAHMLQKAIKNCDKNAGDSLNQLTTEENAIELNRPIKFDPNFKFDFVTCSNLNISACELSENSEKFVVTVYNPLAHSTFEYIRVPVNDFNYEVMDYRSVPIPTQIVSIPDEIQSLSYRQSKAQFELVFMANELPPLGYKSYFVQRTTPIKQEIVKNEPQVFLINNNDGYLSDEPFATEVIIQSEPLIIGNKYLNLSFDQNGLLSSASADGIRIRVQQNFYLYEGASGDNKEYKNRSSGAYIFRPNTTEAQFIVKQANIRVVRGAVVDEVHQTFNDWISQVIRVYKNENFAEFEWLVGEIPVGDGIGREIITRFDTDIQSNDVFYTDSNGREMLKRQRNHRNTWNIELMEKISGNYYPVTAKIAIEDQNRRLAILTDRAQGGSSIAEGSIELMVHRRLLHDDAFGVDEALNETVYGKGLIARGTHYFVLGARNLQTHPSAEANERFVQLQKLLPSWVFFSDASKFTYDTWRTSYNHIYSGLSLSLPKNVHILTFEPWRDNSILIRFEHILATAEDEQYSMPVTFDFKDVFRAYDIVEIRETTLAANQWLSETTRFNFTAKTSLSNLIPFPKSVNETDAEIEKCATHDCENHEAANIMNPDISERQYRRTTYPHLRNRRVQEASDDEFTITLKPMEIRTFVATLEWQPESIDNKFHSH